MKKDLSVEDLIVKARKISDEHPFSPFPPPTDEQGNIIIVESGLDKDFMERLERGDDLRFIANRSSGSDDDMPL